MAELVTVGGEQALFLDVVPNWRDAVAITREFKTDIFSSYSGIEQRRALRQTARREVSMAVQGHDASFRSVLMALSTWRGGGLLIADPIRKATLAQNILQGQITIALMENYPWLAAGRIVALQHKRRVGYRVIQSVVGFEVTFAAGGADAWPVGTHIRPMLRGHLLDGQSFRVLTDDVFTATMDLSVTPGYDPEDAGEAGLLVDGLEVWDKSPNWREPLSLDFEADIGLLDFDRGRRQVTTRRTFPRRIQKNLYLNRTRQEALEAEQFFLRMKGRQGTFLMPSGTSDIQFSQINPLLSGGYTAIMEGPELSGLWAGNEAFRRIAVHLRDGRVLYNVIEDASVASGGWGNSWGLHYSESSIRPDTLVTFRDPWPETVQPADIKYVSWLLPSRLASDSLTITHETESVSQFTLSTQNLMDFSVYPDTRSGWGYDYGLNYGGPA